MTGSASRPPSREIFILVPSFRPTGPIKGAVAFANAIAGRRRVSLVALKDGPGVDTPIDPRIRRVCLNGNALARVRTYRQLLRAAGGRPRVASLSCCFSADLVNVVCRDRAFTCASVRGNLPQNYRADYGPPGVPLAIAHLTALRGVDRVVVMTASMARQVARFRGGRTLVEIPNFVDEAPLEVYRDLCPRTGALRFVFLASLSRRKRPDVAIDAVAALRARGIQVRLDMIGDGPLRPVVEARAARLGVTGDVTLHGQLANPYPLLAAADALLLPSVSEGLSRAALEALHLGVPCVLRNADGNAEVIQPGVNGILFDEDDQFPAATLEAGRLGRAGRRTASLLPEHCRQATAAARYLELLESDG